MKMFSKILLILLLIGFLSNCSFLKRSAVLEIGEKNTKIFQMDTFKIMGGNWNNESSNTFVYKIDTNKVIIFNSQFPAPLVSFGPLYLPIIPNFYYFYYVLIGPQTNNLFVNFGFIYQYQPYQIDLSKIHFYQLDNNEEILIDSMKRIYSWEWNLLESEISHTTMIGYTKTNRKISNPIIEIKNNELIRFNLKLSTYDLDEGMKITFENKFLLDDTLKIPDIILKRRNFYKFYPIIFGS